MILACTDGSDYAPSVYRHAAWAASKISAPVHVLHMLDPHHEKPVKVDTSGHMGLGAKSNLLSEIVDLEADRAKAARKKGEDILVDATKQLQSAGVQDILADQKHGCIGDSIKHYEHDADLVVIGKRGNETDTKASHLGKNLQSIVRSCDHPVLVASKKFSEIKRFLLAFDGGESSKRAVRWVAQSPLLKGAECHLLSAGKTGSRLEDALNKSQRLLEENGFAVKTEIRDGEPEQVISAKAAQEQINLLVMGAYGHSKIHQFIVGSTTSAMIRSVKIPVLLFRS